MASDTTDNSERSSGYQYDSTLRLQIIDPCVMPSCYPAITYDAVPQPQRMADGKIINRNDYPGGPYDYRILDPVLPDVPQGNLFAAQPATSPSASEPIPEDADEPIILPMHKDQGHPAP